MWITIPVLHLSPVGSLQLAIGGLPAHCPLPTETTEGINKKSSAKPGGAFRAVTKLLNF
jgi:hypothetical protein